MLSEICNKGKKVFVDTSISIETLKEIASLSHTLVMLSDPEIPLHRFFDRPDPEKQFLYKLIMEERIQKKAMENYRNGLKLIAHKNHMMNLSVLASTLSIEMKIELLKKRYLW